MSYLTDDIMLWEDIVDDAQKTLQDLDVDQEGEPLDVALDDHQGEEELESAFLVMKELMKRFKHFCDHCEYAWKVQEIPAPLRQRLISLDQHNQEKYQKMYVLIQKYAEQMKNSHIREPGPAYDDMDEF